MDNIEMELIGLYNMVHLNINDQSIGFRNIIYDIWSNKEIIDEIDKICIDLKQLFVLKNYPINQSNIDKFIEFIVYLFNESNGKLISKKQLHTIIIMIPYLNFHFYDETTKYSNHFNTKKSLNRILENDGIEQLTKDIYLKYEIEQMDE